VARRLEEARRAAQLLCITPLSFAEIPTRELKSHIASTRDLTRAQLRQHDIEVLWAPAYEGGHQDHDVANFIASTLRDEISVWEFSEYNYAGGKIHSQEFFSPKGAEQRIILTVEEQAAKLRALQVYQSEKGNLSYVRTEQEVFRPLPGYSYSRPPHPGRLFYQRFQWVPYHPRVDYTKPAEVCRALLDFRSSLDEAEAKF
jgi:LmbE family N-acetylglucosaminyl deacetylase